MTTFDDLDDFEIGKHTRKTEEKRETFPCVKCGGTGTFTWGYVHVRSGKCHACNGRGHFLTDPRKRLKAKANRKAKKLNERNEFMKEHNDAFAYLERVQAVNGFFNSLFNQWCERGSLSEKQLASVYKSMAKSEERKAEKESNAVTVELAKLNSLFDTAKESGLKKPALTIGTMRISVAPEHGKNAGHLYVKLDGEYQGKITPAGKFMTSYNAEKGVEGVLKRIASNPEGELRSIGRDTGTCACCGRELTKQSSIDDGIGPICAEKWGL